MAENLLAPPLLTFLLLHIFYCWLKAIHFRHRGNFFSVTEFSKFDSWGKWSRQAPQKEGEVTIK